MVLKQDIWGTYSQTRVRNGFNVSEPADRHSARMSRWPGQTIISLCLCSGVASFQGEGPVMGTEGGREGDELLQ